MHEDDAFILKFKIRVFFRSYTIPCALLFVGMLVIAALFFFEENIMPLENQLLAIEQSAKTDDNKGNLPPLPYVPLEPLEKFGLQEETK